MATLKQILPNHPAIWDGAMGSLLLAAGLQSGTAPECWNLERPEIIQGIHRDYYQAGSDAVQTNTFGGNRLRLAETGCPYSVDEINRKGAQLALETRPPGKLVAGDMGPCGLSFPPLGKASERKLSEVFAEQAAVLTDSGVDLLCVETISDLREARAALKGIQRVSQLPVAISMTFRVSKRGFHTIMGDAAVSSLRELLDLGASAVGANCTLSSALMTDLAGELRAAIPETLIIQPNAGDPEVFSDQGAYRVRYPQGPYEFASHVVNAMKLGIDIVGGCCGTTPEHIARLALERSRLSS